MTIPYSLDLHHSMRVHRMHAPSPPDIHPISPPEIDPDSPPPEYDPDIERPVIPPQGDPPPNTPPAAAYWDCSSIACLRC